MSNYSDYRAGLRACHKYLKQNDVSDCISRARSNWNLRHLLAKEHPIPDYWKYSAWYWLGIDELNEMLETGTFTFVD